MPAAESTSNIVARYREGAREAYESTSMLHCPLAAIVGAVSEAQSAMAAADPVAPCLDPTGHAADIYAELRAADSRWRGVPAFSLPSVTEVPSSVPAGRAAAEGDAPGATKKPRTLPPWEIAPASFAALAMLTDCVVSSGGTEAFVKMLFG